MELCSAALRRDHLPLRQDGQGLANLPCGNAVPLLLEKAQRLGSRRVCLVDAAGVVANLREVEKGPGLRIEEVGCLAERDRLPGKLLGLVEPTLTGEDSRPDPSPDDLREEVVVKAEVLAYVREPQRFVGTPLREERLGEVSGCRRPECLVAHLLEDDVPRTKALLGRA